MDTSYLVPDDLPPSEWTEQDAWLRRRLEEAVNRCFYESCDGVMQALLINCHWGFSITASALTLVIHCPDQAINLRVLNNVVAIANLLKPFSKTAKISICPPNGEALDVRVDEVSV
ncbi:hypothetical protein ACKFKG_14790 [Phormidesmis sp. 146-35]